MSKSVLEATNRCKFHSVSFNYFNACDICQSFVYKQRKNSSGISSCFCMYVVLTEIQKRVFLTAIDSVNVSVCVLL